MPINTPSLASRIDHTVLKADATKEEIERLCAEARQYGFATVCVNSYWIPHVSKLLTGSDVKPVTVVGFPLGANLTESKVFESKEAIRLGALEIDMVLNIGALKGDDFETVLKDIQAVVEASKPHAVKVILETALLSESQKMKACELALRAGAAFVKTSTGFAASGATVQDVALMRRVVGDSMGVKASGGIRTREDAQKMLDAGATRLGTSASVLICK
ncbi:MAG: deoxyribose-phosphate aldolase [Myxococcota bacterium]